MRVNKTAVRAMLHHAQDLIELARETSSERRRELLRILSDVFISAEGDTSTESHDEFTRTVGVLLDQLDTEVRAEFAGRFANRPGAPAELMVRLAHDVIEVARPVLCCSETLEDSELVAVAMMRGQEHLRAISARTRVSELVCDAIVSRGDDETLVTLARNLGARFSRDAFERLADRSETVKELRAPLVERDDTPLDLAHEMLVFVESALREQIMARVGTVKPAELETALRMARERAESRRISNPDEARARREVRELKSRGRLDKGAVVDFLRGGDEPRFLAGMAELLEIEFEAARKIWRAEELDALAIAVRAAEGDRAFFVTIAMEREGVDVRDPKRARVFGEDYEAIPVDAAKRVIRFWRVRREANSEDAA